MFAKPYKVKSHNTFKNSEKKKFVQRILDEFPNCSEEKVKELMPVKSNTSCMKLTSHSGVSVSVYVVDGFPLFLECDDEGLYPTVCVMWRIPDLVPVLTVRSDVVNILKNGAPLYVPGVVITPGSPLTSYEAGAPIAVCTTDNAAVAVVGRATINSATVMFTNSGACMEVVHSVGDALCRDPKFSKIERPRLGPPSLAADAVTAALGQLSMTGGPAAESPEAPPAAAPVPNQPTVISEVPPSSEHNQTRGDTNEIEDESLCEEDAVPEDMDGLLKYTLLSFIKERGKAAELPLKTNLLYKNHLIPMCPEGRTLDVKKSTYKKMGKFLENMQQEGLLEVRELEKGVDAITSINGLHPLVRQHRGRGRAPEEVQHQEEYVPPQVTEMYCVTAAVMPLFRDLRKGTPVRTSEIREAVMRYVQEKQLSSAQSRGQVTCDVTLATITGHREGKLGVTKSQREESLKYDELMSRVSERMTPCTETRFADGTVRCVKTRLQPVQMKVVTRSGNKKVTLVSNLEQFGFVLSSLSRECQRRAAASAGVTRAPGALSDQLMLQGDQTHFIAKLLIEKFGLPKKYVEGADKALNKKK